MQAETHSKDSLKKSAKILIIDADIAIRSLVTQGLKSERKTRVYEAGSWGGVDQKIRSQHFDVIVLGQLLLSDLPQSFLSDDSLSLLEDHDTLWSELSDDRAHTQNMLLSLLITLSESCERLVLLYDESDPIGDAPLDAHSSHLHLTDFDRSENAWNHLLLRGAQLCPQLSQHCLLYPRPTRPELINVLDLLGRELCEQRPSEQQMTNVDQAIVDQQLVLWAGPSDHPLVPELRRACDSIHHFLISVDSAQHALRETRRTRFEVCFVHNELSDMAGLSLVRSLRREVGESLPVAYVGVAQKVADRLEGVHAGVSLYINETAGFDAVTQALRHLQNLGTHGVSRVLIIDDEESVIADALTEELKRGKFQVSCLTSALRTLELLTEVQSDLLIINAEMKGLGGFELCRTLRAMPEWQTLPIMLIGENDTDELRVAAYRAGADDYLSSEREVGVIRACLEGRLERSRTVQERADRDGLTGLLIRRAFNDALLSLMALANRRGSTVAVCLIDLDHFKSINDTYGHIAGDRVLSALGRLLSSSFRVEDLRGRWGGEEFVVAFSDETGESAKSILDRARREFIRYYFDGEHGERFQATFSAGIACYPEAGETIEDVFKVADRRLYAVKEAGRNNIFAHDLSVESEDQAPIDHRSSDAQTNNGSSIQVTSTTESSSVKTQGSGKEEKPEGRVMAIHETGDEALSMLKPSELAHQKQQSIERGHRQSEKQHLVESTDFLPPFSDED